MSKLVFEAYSHQESPLVDFLWSAPKYNVSFYWFSAVPFHTVPGCDNKPTYV